MKKEMHPNETALKQLDKVDLQAQLERTAKGFIPLVQGADGKAVDKQLLLEWLADRRPSWITQSIDHIVAYCDQLETPLTPTELATHNAMLEEGDGFQFILALCEPERWRESSPEDVLQFAANAETALPNMRIMSPPIYHEQIDRLIVNYLGMCGDQLSSKQIMTLYKRLPEDTAPDLFPNYHQRIINKRAEERQIATAHQQGRE